MVVVYNKMNIFHCAKNINAFSFLLDIRIVFSVPRHSKMHKWVENILVAFIFNKVWMLDAYLHIIHISGI